jgi:hypothetical protein
MFSREPCHQYIRYPCVYPPERKEIVAMLTAMESRQKWFIITSEEIGRIRELLFEVEQDTAGPSRENVREIASMITLIERRLV